jgi:hypothetical protein
MNRPLAILLSVCAAAVAQPAYAVGPAYTKPGGVSFDTGVTQAFTYDSNPSRLTSGEDALFGSTTSPELAIRWKTPRTLIESASRVDVNVFDDSDYDSIDLNQKLLLSRSNERWGASLRGLLNYDTTRTSEVTNFSVNVPKVRSRKLSASPEITYKPSPRSRVALAATITDLQYDSTRFTDYNLYSVNPSYELRFDPRNTGTITLNAQRYQTTSGTNSKSDSYGPTLGWTHVVNPRLTLRASAGGLSNHKSGAGAVGADRHSWNYVFSGSAVYRGDRDVFDFTATRAREPFGNGTETLLDTFAINERHMLNPQISLKANAKYQQADYETLPGINLDYSYGGGAGVAYRVTPKTELSADYRYRREQLTTISNEIDQHVVLLSLTYEPNWSGE